MKVLAKKEENIIVEVTKEEFANLMGKYSKYDINFADLKEDTEVNISSIYNQHYALTNLLNTPDYNLARTKLKNMLEVLTPVDNLLEKLKETYEIK